MSAHYYNQAGELVGPWTPGAWPSPSTILSRVRSYEYEALVAREGQEEADLLMERKAAIGTRVHKACELWVINGFNAAKASKDASLLVEDLPYFAGFVNWWERNEAEHDLRLIGKPELFVESTKYKYRGTLDLPVELDSQLWIIDIKTGMDNVRHGLQLKFYQQAYYEMTGRRARMGVLALTPKRSCGYRNSRSPYGLQEFKEPLRAILDHRGVDRWWSRKHQHKQPVEQAVWTPEEITHV